MKCPNCGNEVECYFTNLDSPYSIDDPRSKICEYCATDEQAQMGNSLKELNDTRQA